MMLDAGEGFDLHTEGPAGVVVARSLEVDGVSHGFATRLGGVTEGPCASLTFGPRGQSERQLLTNIERLGLRLGFDAARLYRVRQVHSADVLVIERAGVDLAGVAAQEADALVTNVRDHFVAVQTADCVPVLLHAADEKSESGGVVAAVHAGWRGIVAGVVERAVEAMVERFGIEASSARAAVGPSIGPRGYEVDEDVAAQFERFDGVVRRGLGDKPHLDLRLAVRQILSSCGLAADKVAVTSLSTDRRPDLFFSYRVQGPDTGRHLSAIGLVSE